MRAQFLGVSLSCLFAACTGQEGTIGISVIAAPDSDLLSRIERLDATYTGRDATYSSTRDDDGTLNLGIDVEADGTSGDLVLEGFAADGDRIAVGRVGPLPLAAIDADVVAFLAPPNSITQSPIALSSPRSHMGGTEASFGALLAGGLGTDGPVNDVSVYSTYLHSLQSALPLPEARSSMAVSSGNSGFFYMVGGEDENQEPRSDSYAFDTRVPPAGSYRPLVVEEEFARSRATLAVVGEEQFLVSGDPALLLDGVRGTVQPLLDGARLTGQAATVITDNSLQVIVTGANVVNSEFGVGAAIFAFNEVTHLQAPPELVRTQHRTITLLTGQALTLGGELEDGTLTLDAVRYSPNTEAFDVFEFLATGRKNPAVALTNQFLVVIGGEAEDGAAIEDAEIFDVRTLERVATVPLVLPRKNAVAAALGNGQVLIAGGQDDNGAPTEILSLFTPNETP